jgi:hypothetical protein
MLHIFIIKPMQKIIIHWIITLCIPIGFFIITIIQGAYWFDMNYAVRKLFEHELFYLVLLFSIIYGIVGTFYYIKNDLNKLFDEADNWD